MTRVFEVLPADFPIIERPYSEMAEAMGMSEGELLGELADLRDRGYIRRVAAMVSHRAVAYEGNAMVVWHVTENEIEKAGAVMAAFDEVSHCYERDTGGYWHYNLYTMVHGRTRQECLAVIEQMSEHSGIADYRVLFSVREFKKTSFAVRE